MTEDAGKYNTETPERGKAKSAKPVLKGPLRCWIRDPKTGAARLHDYQPGDPVPDHLTQTQRQRLIDAGVI